MLIRRKAGMWASTMGTIDAEGWGARMGVGAKESGFKGIAGFEPFGGCCLGTGSGGAGCVAVASEGVCCCCCDGGAVYLGDCCFWKKDRIDGCWARVILGLLGKSSAVLAVQRKAKYRYHRETMFLRH